MAGSPGYLRTGYVDKNLLCYLGGFPGDGLSEVFGIISEEIDTLYPSDRNHIRFAADQRQCEVVDYAEYLRVADATVLAAYEEDYIKGTAAVTSKAYGDGMAYYVACRLGEKDMQYIYKKVYADAGIETRKLPEDVEYHVRYGENEKYEFYLNASMEKKVVGGVSGIDLLTDKNVDGTLELEGCQVAVLKIE